MPQIMGAKKMKNAIKNNSNTNTNNDTSSSDNHCDANNGNNDRESYIAVNLFSLDTEEILSSVDDKNNENKIIMHMIKNDDINNSSINGSNNDTN